MHRRSHGTDPQTRDCRNGTNQRWTLTDSDRPAVYGGKCPDVPGHARGP